MIPYSEEEYYYKLDNVVLSSCQQLRQVFKDRWKRETGKDWIDDQDQLDTFVAGLGQRAFKMLQPHQKSVIKSTLLEDWDLSLLSHVLQNFGSGDAQKNENSAALQLRKLRNVLAHNGKRKMSKEDYNSNIGTFRSSMQRLGTDEKDVEKLIEKAGVTSSLKALEFMKTLHEKAQQFFRDGNPDKAVECFTEAINLPSLLPANLGTAYEKRAEYLLSQIKDPLAHRDKCSGALLDVTKALELNSRSWMAHYLAAKCYRWKNELSKAIAHYEKALALSPAQEKVKADFDSCKILAGVQSRDDHLTPLMMPMNLGERVAHLEHETGIKMNKKDFVRFNVEMGKTIKGQDHVFRGHQYFAGWDVQQNFTEAAKHYAKAAKLKNAEGMYNLALCYHHGNGVKQDVQEALRMYREIAEMDRQTPGQETLLKCNAGVAGAQHVIGMMYNDGVGVERDYILAASWYKRAMENGIAQSANNLGILYSNGQGMPRDDKMAELCWKQAVNLNDVNAPASLMSYYMDQMEPEKALDMLRIGRELGNSSLLKISDDEFNKLVVQVKSARTKIQPEVIEFEKAKNLKTKGLTFQERVSRKLHFLEPRFAKMEKIFRHSRKSFSREPANPQPENWGGKVQDISMQTIAAITMKAMQGSITAREILETITNSIALNDLVDTYEGSNQVLEREIVNHLYNIVISEFHLHRISNEPKLKSIVARLFKEKSDLIGEEDMMIRLCFVVFNLDHSARSGDMYDVEILKEGVRRYPDNEHYYKNLAAIFGLKGMFKEGRVYAGMGLKLFPENINLLYSYAVFLRRDESSRYTLSERVEAFKQFLSVAPSDHRKVPEAYYQISNLIMVQDLKKNAVSRRRRHQSKNETMDQIRAYFQRGQEAEKGQLPCYLPYGESQIKFMVETMLTFNQDKPLSKAVTSVESQSVKGILEIKTYLLSPTRKGVIQLHRQNLKEMHIHHKAPETDKSEWTTTLSTVAPKLKQTVAKRMSAVKAITLQEMNPTEDKIYENRVLDLTIIDEVNAFFSSIHLIAEDENGDVTRLYIYNVGRDKGTLANFQPGCTIAVINPYMRIGVDTTNAIRVDEPKCLIFLEKVENMCRFCGEGNASSKCSQCKRPYCSRECQKLDWKELDHKLICSLKY